MEKKKTSLKRKIITALITAAALVAAGICAVFCINGYVVGHSADKILSPEAAAELDGVDCIIVLGCRVNGDVPSAMLGDRLTRGVELYERGAAPKLLMSGDHGRKDYDEVNVMKKFATDRGVPSEDVFMDHAGFSTYETMYRAAEIFKAERVVIVSQSYHLYRAVYIAEKLGLEAYGVSSDLQSYIKQPYYDFRELLARNKDFFYCVLKPSPTYLGTPIPITGNGNLTND